MGLNVNRSSITVFRSALKIFLLTSRLQLNTWAKWDTFRVFLMSVNSLMDHRLWETDFTLMDTSPWSRSGVTTDKQRCNAHLYFSLNCMASVLTRREGGLLQAVGNGKREVPEASSFLPHPGYTSLHRTGAAALCQLFEVSLIQVSGSHWQLHDNVFSPCCFQIKNKMRFPLLCPISLFFSIFKSKLDAIIVPLKSRVIVALPAV